MLIRVLELHEGRRQATTIYRPIHIILIFLYEPPRLILQLLCVSKFPILKDKTVVMMGWYLLIF